MMKEQPVLNVLIYLFKNHLQNKLELDDFSDELAQELENAGFDIEDIEQAFVWLSKLERHTSSEGMPLNHHRSDALRVYSDYEIKRISPAARGYLTKLEQQNILDPHLREIIINQALIFEKDNIDLNLLKWLTLMVLCNQVQRTEAKLSMDLMTLEECHASLQ